MAVRKIFEPELDGCSVIIWEAGAGTRVVFPDERSAEIASQWLIKQANRFHEAKDSNDGSQDENMVSLVVYGDQLMTEFALVRGYLKRVRRLGYEIQEGLERKSKEFW